jgi:hypothetical protein
MMLVIRYLDEESGGLCCDFLRDTAEWETAR